MQCMTLLLGSTEMKPCACPVLHNSPRSTKTVEKEQRVVEKRRIKHVLSITDSDFD